MIIEELVVLNSIPKEVEGIGGEKYTVEGQEMRRVLPFPFFFFTASWKWVSVCCLLSWES